MQSCWSDRVREETTPPESDVDLGLYYRQDNPLDVQALDRLASRMDDRLQTGLVTPISGWGPYINAGSWLQIAGREVGLIYCDLDLVEQTVGECMLVVLFALNEQYWMDEKGALGATIGFSICPERFIARVETVFAQLCMNKAALVDAVSAMDELCSEVNALAELILGGN